MSSLAAATPNIMTDEAAVPDSCPSDFDGNPINYGGNPAHAAGAHHELCQYLSRTGDYLDLT